MLNTNPGTIVIWLGGAIVVWLSLELLLCAMIVATAPSKWSWRRTIYGSAMIALGFGKPLAAEPQPIVEEPLASNERKAD